MSGHQRSRSQANLVAEKRQCLRAEGGIESAWEERKVVCAARVAGIVLESPLDSVERQAEAGGKEARLEAHHSSKHLRRDGGR